MQTAAEGNGPVNALDAAVRKALRRVLPGVDEVRLVDYKVRIIDSSAGTGARMRVLIESHRRRSTTGARSAASTDIIEASGWPWPTRWNTG